MHRKTRINEQRRIFIFMHTVHGHERGKTALHRSDGRNTVGRIDVNIDKQFNESRNFLLEMRHAVNVRVYRRDAFPQGLYFSFHAEGYRGQAGNAQRVAEWLQARDEVLSVNYAGLPSSPWYERGQKYAPKGTGGVLAFEIQGGIEAGKRFVEGLELHSHVANIGDVRSLVIHPASTTHSQLTADEQAATGVSPGLVRLSVGIEHIDDILADLEAGFRAAKGA